MTERKIALSIEEAADYTGIGRNTLRKLVEWKSHSADGTTVNAVAIPIFKVLVVYIVITKDRVK